MNFIPHKKFLLLAIPVIPLFIGIVFLNYGLLDIAVQKLFVSGDRQPAYQTKTELQSQRKKKHLPKVVKAVYSTMYTASEEKQLEHLLDIINKTELNAVVIDVKDSDGRLIFDTTDIGKITAKLKEQDIYIIGRVVAFQDNGAARDRPQTVLKNKNGTIWRDRAGFAWVDPASKEGWEHLMGVSKQALDAGFDEINYDYIRFPSEGALNSAVYPSWNASTTKSETIKSFAAYAKKTLKEYNPDALISIDIFGYTFLRNDDLGIGQKLEELVGEFDFVYPMVYPSHYAPGNFGFQNPVEHPYEVIKGTIESGLEQLGSEAEQAKPKIRPWLQAFDMGAKYTPDMMKAQIKAVSDTFGEKTAGWLLWDPNNRYNGVEEYLANEE